MNKSFSIQDIIRIGLIAGAVTLSMCMIGLVESFAERDVITEQLTMGQLLFFAGSAVAGYIVANRLNNIVQKLPLAALAGLVSVLPVVILVWLSTVWESIRDSFINVSPELIQIMTLASEQPFAGLARVAAIFAVLGLLGGLFTLLPNPLLRALMIGFLWAMVIGLMAEIFVNILRSRLDGDTMDRIFGDSGILLTPFIIIFVLVSVLSFWWRGAGQRQYAALNERMSPRQMTWSRTIFLILFSLFLMILPSILGVYLTEILNNVGLFILMGLGLNIAIGLAGLLDLGYVTNFAVGAYIMALLTSGSEYGLSEPISFWLALPICVLCAMVAGFVFALPVLRMRGDYLAIATLGFGEIIRVLVKSDAMKPILGGAQGILQIPSAAIGGFFGNILQTIVMPINTFLERWDLGILSAENGEVVFGKPPQLFYLIVLACLLMLFISRRLNNSRTGRRWMAMREDEDVAAAMGINTVNAKVVAFTLSAASGGLAGAIFAAKLGSIFPSSFQVLISINVLSLIIVGGLGSIPGIFVGAFALIGVPELLREFAEFRLLFYGMALIVMMLVRPEGLWPSEVRRRELSSSDDGEPIGGEAMAVSAD